MAMTFQSVVLSCQFVSIVFLAATCYTATYINHCESAKNLDLLQLANRCRWQRANVENVHRVIVTDEASEVMGHSGIFPGLGDRAIIERVSLLWPHTKNIARLLLLLIMEDGVFQESMSTPNLLS